MMNGAVQTSWNPPFHMNTYSEGLLEETASLPRTSTDSSKDEFDASKSLNSFAQNKFGEGGKPAHASVIIGWD